MPPPPHIPRAVAVFQGTMGVGVSGRVDFYQATSTSPTQVVIGLSGLTATAGALGQYHVHEKPVDWYDPAGPCSSSSTGGHFNPMSAVGKCDPTKPESCELGDLSGKHGAVTGVSLQTQYTDTFLPLSGAYSIVGRSLVLHDSTGNRYVCANIIQTYDPMPVLQLVPDPTPFPTAYPTWPTPAPTPPKLRYVAKFDPNINFGVNGRIDFFQSSADSPTSVTVDVRLRRPPQSGHCPRS